MNEDFRSNFIKWTLIGLMVISSINKVRSQSDLDCDFENDFCKWKNYTSVGTLYWQRKTSPTTTTGSALYPPGDHTIGKGGYYIQINTTSPTQKNWKGRVISANFTKSASSTSCFTFWYFMYGSGISTLNVFLVENNVQNTNARFIRIGSQGKGWNFARVELNLTTINYNVLLEGVSGGQNGDIAIDDILYKDGQCEQDVTDITCDFENNFICGYKNDSTAKMSWIRYTGLSETTETGPTADVTTGSVYGHFMLFDTSITGALQNYAARLISPSKQITSGRSCLEFYFTAFGANVGTFNVYSFSNGFKTLRYTVSQNQGRPWRIIRIDLNGLSDFQIIFEGIRGNGIRGDIAIDDVTLIPDASCPKLYDCDFETKCTWSDVTDDRVTQLTWLINQGSTQSVDTGPTTDSTGDTNGHYAYIEASYPAKFGDKARLQSAVVPSTPALNYCLKFWYHMFGEDTGVLNIQSRSINAGVARPAVSAWYLNGPQGNVWLQGQAPIQSDEPFYIFVDGIVGSGYLSDIAIDNLVLENNTCDIKPEAARPSNTSISCNFESDECGWFPDITGKFNWVRHRGGAQSQGPVVDHTTLTPDGWYLFINTADHNAGEKGRIISNEFSNNNTLACFQFWYQIYGFDDSSLNVYYRKSDGTLGKSLWTKVGSQGTKWRLAKVDIPKSTFNGYLTLEGVIGTGNYYGYIAVDDTSYSSGSLCPPTPDLVECDFEESQCGYKEDTTAAYRWTRVNGTATDADIYDHTTDAENGHFMYPLLVNASNPNIKTRLTSVVMQNQGQKCLSFFYSMFDSDQNTLTVYLSQSSQISQIWTNSLDQGPYWKRAFADISDLATYQVTFEANVGKHIAIDDVSLIDGVCPHYGDCDFEEDDFCLWESIYENTTHEWIIYEGDLYWGVGPAVDHTLGLAIGKYMYFENYGDDDLARVESPAFDPTDAFCMEFWYYIDGPTDLIFRLYQKDVSNKQETLLWKLGGSQGRNWLRGTISLKSTNSFTVIIEGLVDPNNSDQGWSGISIDDIVFTNTQCPVTPFVANPYSTTVGVATTASPGQVFNTSSVSFNCDFEKDFCGWTSVLQDFEWVRKQGLSSTSPWQPTYDTTLGNSQGYYLYIDTSPPKTQGQKAQIISPMVSKSTSSVHCLKFSYFMYGDNPGSLKMYLRYIGGDAAIFSTSGSKGDYWIIQFIQFTFGSNIDFQALLEGIVDNGAYGTIAVDDVIMEDGACTKEVCDFEGDDICGYTNDAQANFNWTRNSGPTNSYQTGPSVDHTLGTAAGHYMYIESSYPQLQSHTARLLTPLKYSNKQCLQFYYHMWGGGIGALNILSKTENGTLSLPFWTRNKNYGDFWNLAEVTVQSSEKYQIAFEGVVGSSFEGDIAIDDVKVENRECPPSGFCDFESKPVFCTWYNVQGEDDFDWEEGNSATSTFGTGPSVDHTFGNANGHYIFIETSTPRKEGDQAWFSSLIFPVTINRCMRFWYSMNGDGIGSLRVDIVYENKAKETLWLLSKDKGDQWLEGTVGFNSKNMTYRIVIVGTRGSNDRGDIAVDDISFLDSTCGLSPSEVATELAGLTTTVPTTTRLPSSDEISCNFDANNTCGWTDDTTAELKWTLNKGSTSSLDTGPTSDVSGKGYYIYLETSGVKKGDKARLISPEINATLARNTHCLQFYYHLYGNDIGEVSIKILTSAGLNSNPIWKRDEQHGNVWLKAHLTLSPVTSVATYRIALEAVVGNGYEGDVAIDDILFTPNKRCSPVSEYGDKVKHYCDFESPDICGYTIDNTSTTNPWTRAGPPGNFEYPDKENTYQTTGNGYYMRYKTTNAAPARFSTPEFDASIVGSCLGFYLYSYWTYSPKLTVYARYNSTDYLLLAPPTYQGNKWVQFEVEVPLNFDTYSIIFQGTYNNLASLVIGIDDLSIKNGLCRKHPGDCDFESVAFCSWTNSKNDEFDWLLHQGSTPSWNTGPSVDHTFNSSNGTYAFIETSYPRKKGDRAWLVSELFSVNADKAVCFTLWYHAFGTSIGSLRIYTTDSNQTNKNLLWELNGQQSINSIDWKQAILPITNLNNEYVILIEGVIGSSIFGDISIDDIVILNYSSSCVRQPAISLPITTTTLAPTSTPSIYSGFACDFEQGLCGWSQMASSTVNWIRKNGLSSGGPRYDHTYQTNTSYYLYFESNDDYYDYFFNGVTLEDVARLKSPNIDGNFKQCLKFWYYMNGYSVGQLRVFYYIDKGNNTFEQTTTPVWYKKDSHGAHWQFAQINYPGGNQSVSNFIIEGYSDYLSSGQVSIDDIDFNFGDCESPDFHSVSCDFEEEHICGYESDPRANFNWVRHNGTTTSSNTGPSIDVTTGTKFGYYMYIETSYPQVQGNIARLLSPITNSTGKCLWFWYHAFGKDIGEMNVYSEVQMNATANQLNKLWTVNKNLGNKWFIARVPTSYSYNYRIIFEGIVGRTFYGDAAIDDVFLSKSPCPSPPDCDFENSEFDFCSWMNEDNTIDNFDWEIYSSNTNTQFGIIPDSSFFSSSGHFIVANGRVQGHFARLFSELRPPTSSNGICITFYFYVNGDSGYNLKIKVAEYNTSGITYWSLTDTQTTKGSWRYAEFNFNANDYYRVYLEGYVGSSSSHFFAVDDIEFEPGSPYCNTYPTAAKPSDLTTTTAQPTTTISLPSIKELDCDFESPCSWYNDQYNKFNWSVLNGSFATAQNLGPSVDHTLGSVRGSYIVPIVNNNSFSSAASYKSPSMVGSKCIEFYYYMYGPEVGNLSLYQQTNLSAISSGATRLWMRTTTGEPGWILGTVSYNPTTTRTFQFRFDFQLNSLPYNGYVAIDDILVHEGSCNIVDVCDFENSQICGFTNDPVAAFEWKRGTGTLFNGTFTNDIIDHTYGTNVGNFMYLNVTSSLSSTGSARLISTVQNKTAGTCVRFYYLFVGASAHTLRAYAKISNNLGTQIFTAYGFSSFQWFEGQATVASLTDTWQLVFEATKGSTSTGLIAIDDVKISKGTCPNPGDCNFEDGTLCEYTNMPSAQVNWVVRRGAGPNLNTGPSVDHTTGSDQGAYALMNTQTPVQTGWKASLSSQLLSATYVARCVRFWYFMRAPASDSYFGSLKVIKFSYQTQTNTTLWSLQYGQGQMWYEGRFTYIENTQHSIIFEGTKGLFLGDIAIDDITFHNNNCSISPATANPDGSSPVTTRTTITTTPLSTYAWTPNSQFDCNFENGFGVWQNDTTGDFNWKLAKGYVVYSSGPRTDHTYQNASGTYAYVDTRYPTKIFQKCRLQSPLVNGGEDKCLEFYYNAYGVDVNAINVYLRRNGQLGAPVWTRSRNQGNSWLRGEIRLSNIKDSYQIVFEGVSGGYSNGIIAIDDIRLLSSCPAPTDRFCDFENEQICGYKNLTSNNVPWLRGSPSTNSAGPSTDHTTQSGNGYYMYATGISTNATLRALLASNEITPNSEQCVEFYYYQEPSLVGSLNIYSKLRTQDVASIGFPLWTEPFTNDGIPGWKVAQVSLGHSITNQPFQIIFEEYVESNKPGNKFNIYLDDVFIRDQSCLPRGDCDFENGFCSWSNVPSMSNIDWLLSTGNNANQNGAPSVDHTIGGPYGSYLLVPVTDSADSGKNAYLSSEIFEYATSPKGRCFTFWYYINGNNAGSLSFYVKDLITNTTVITWQYGGFDMGDQWNYGSFGFYYENPYVVLIQANTGNSPSNIAVDDIFFKESQFCSISPPAATAGTGLPLPSPSLTTTKKPTSTPTPGIYDCDFETGFCSWSNDYSRPLNWTRNTGSTSSYETGPSVDHTLGTKYGWYIYMEASYPAKRNDTARLQSQKINDFSSLNCLTFYYHMYGEHIDTLNVFTKDSNGDSLVWTKQGNQGRIWMQGTVNLQSNESYNIIFEAVRGVDYAGDISLDDLSFQTGACPSNEFYKCDFEKDLCGFTNDPTGKFNWTRYRGRYSTSTGPTVDHTTSSANGYYLILGTTYQPMGSLARVISPTFPFVPTGYCLTWYYHMLGVDVEKLSVFIKTDDKQGLFWRYGENVGNIWNAAQFTIPKISNYQNFSIVFQGEKGDTNLGLVAIDDIKLEYGECPTFGTCTFDNYDYCFWQNVYDDGRDEFDWELGAEDTSSYQTGPTYDHTLGNVNGVFLFIEASEPIKQGFRALLESTLFLPTPSYGLCMDFWYHMYGSGMGTLNIYVNVSNTTSLLWTQNGNKGNQWLNGQVPILSSKAFRISIEAVRGPTYASDTAIDDIDFVEKSCSLLPENANPLNLVTIPIITTTRSLRPVSAYDCTFEKDFCVWSNSAGNKFNWTRAQGIQGTQIAGPLPSDHTLGTADGWYAFTNIANRLSTDIARIETTSFYGQRCMEFYYYLFGSSRFTLNVYIKSSNQLGYPIWSRIDSQGDLWRLGRVTVNSGSYFSVVMEVTNVYNGMPSDIIALDDIYFTTGACQDSSDVNKICTFSNGDLCGYNVTTTGNQNFKWQLYTPALKHLDLSLSKSVDYSVIDDTDQVKSLDISTKDVALLPINDHTTGGYGSGYVYVTTSGFTKTDSTVLTSKLYAPFVTTNANEAARCLEFYFFLRGTNTAQLNVRAKTSTTVRYQLWSRNYDHSGYWWKGEANVKLISNYSIEFEAAVGSDPNGGIVALDDISLRNGNCSSLAGTCDFEKRDFCNWMNVNGTNFNWLIYSGSTPTGSTGPSSDHTLGTTLGYYIYIETSLPSQKGWKAQLISEPFVDKTAGCVNFWYHMYGSSIGSLNVYLTYGSSKDILWTLTGASGNIWLQGLAPFQSDNEHQIIFEGIAGNSIYGDIALDDISVRRESCQVQPQNAMPQIQASGLVDCGFEGTYCNWSNETVNTQFNWTLNSGSTASANTGPSGGADNTNGYLYIETSYTVLGNVARIVSPSIPKPTSDGYCLSFFYHMWGSDIGSLIAYVLRTGTTSGISIFTKNGTQEEKWKRAYVLLNGNDINYDFRLAFDGIAGKGFLGDIAIDEISLRVGSCPPSRVCDFETDFCNWVNDTTGNFYWTRHRNGTSSVGTGPSFDHTTLSQNGYYIYIETSYPRVQGDKARLISPTYSASNADCFKFWYHLYGSTIGSLNVYLRQNNQLAKNLWTRSGNFGNMWRFGHVTVRSTTEFQIALEGVVGRSFDGDIAVDDIEFLNGECYSEGSCDFEEDYCGYYNTKEGDDFDWIRGKGQIYSITGPSVDHTTNTADGYYAYINPVYGQKAGEKAWLISETLSVPEPACLNWYMNLYGIQIGELNVIQRNADGSNRTLYAIKGNQGKAWFLGQATVISNVTTYMDIIFEAKINGTLGNSAIDDIELVRGGTCEYLNTTTQAPTTSLSLPAFGLQCDFEVNFCDWYRDPTPIAQWQRQNGRSATYGTAPLNDVTQQNTLGYYAVVNANLNNQQEVAILKSPAIDYNVETCLEFWYQVNGGVSSSLAVALRDRTNKTELWKRKGTAADSWSHAYLRLPQLISQKWLEFEGDVSSAYVGYVAIDEVRLLFGSCPASKFCDFESPDICNYQHDVTGKFQWTRNRGSTDSYSTGPPYDHTYQTAEGYYMYIETSYPRVKDDKARLISETINRVPGGVCVRFWYHAYGASIGSLNVYTRVNSQLSATPIWKITGNQANQWRTAAVTATANENFQVVFEGVVGSSFDGDISIDDIFIDTSGPCKPAASCAFEDSLCLWSQDTTSTFNLLRITSEQLQTIPNIYQPSLDVDTTTNTKFGHFLWIGPGYNPNVGANKTSTLVSETLFYLDYISNGACFTFMYFINGQDPGKINVYRKLYSATKSLLTTISVDQVSSWKQATVALSSVGQNFELYIEVVLGSSNGNIAIDDINLYPGDCANIPTTPNPALTFNCGDGTTISNTKVCDFIKDCANGLDEKVCADCDFENSTCNWIDVSLGSLKWNRALAGLSQNGPSVDHTLGTQYGSYAFVDNTNASTYDVASIRLNLFLKPCSSSCELEFYYHMFGTTEDFIAYLFEGSWYTQLLELDQDGGDQWNYARIRLGRISQTFSFEFDGLRYFNGDHDLAIDDIKLINCEFPVPRPSGCPADYFTCQRKACISQTRVCDLIDDCGDGSDELNCDSYHRCDFENGICGWQHDDSAELRWTWHSGTTATYQTGPNRDHTIGTSAGHYVYLETSGVFQNHKSRLISSVYTVSGRCEFRLFYHLYGQDIGAFTIYVRTFTGDRVIFNKDREVGNFWERFDTVITETGPFQIVLEGTVGESYLGDIGVDDTSFTAGCIQDNNITIPTIIPTTTITTFGPCGLDFQCKTPDLQCVTYDKVCNFIDDCGDNSDELDCGTCNFETSWCGWYDESDDETIWTRKKAPSQNPTGPQKDHTTNSTNGYYLITELSPLGGNFIDYARLLGPGLQATGPTCTMSVWIHMGGTLSADLTFYFTNVSDYYHYTFLADVRGPLGNDWKKYDLTIGTHPANFQLEIYAWPESQGIQYTDIALDDVVFKDCALNAVLTDKSLDCDFEDGFCYYLNDPTADFEWERNFGTTTSTNTGPGFDHTTGQGYYAYIESSYPRRQGDKARLTSTLQTKTNENICLSFWYHMFGSDIGALNLYLDQYQSQTNTTFNRTLIWKKEGPKGNRWFNGQKTLISSLPWKITFEGVAGPSYLSDIALDDISSLPGSCPPTKVCDFEDGSCDFNNVNDNTANLLWQIGQPTSTSIDHTTLSNQGSFAYVSFGNSPQNSKARLESKRYDPNGQECLQFWYLLNGLDTSVLNIYEKFNTYYQSIWTKKSHDNDEWRYGQVRISDLGSAIGYTVVFEGLKGLKDNGTVGIDDISIRIGDCLPAINCNFEDFTICSWLQYQYDELDWLLNQGETDSWATGPHVDVTLGTEEGVYLYVESSLPAKQGDRAIIVSEYLVPTLGSCFSVWYFMYGSQVGQFNVYTNDTVNGLKLYSNITGPQGFVWKKLLVDINNPNEFRIALEGVVGKGYQGDIAIDDITYTDGLCSTTTNLFSTTTVTYPISALDCDFDSYTICSWSNDPTGQFNWALNNGSTLSIFTGPSGDHTTDSSIGHYIYIEASVPQKFNDSARIVSPYVNLGTSGGCFKFFYHMFGSDIYRLNVYSQIANFPTGKPIWQKQGNRGDKWLFGHVFVENPNNNIRFIIEGIVGKGPFGDIAVDDVSFNLGSCPVSNECDFESADLCGYVNDINTGFLWNRVQGSSLAPDHSYGTETGHYMSAKSVQPHLTGKTARLYSLAYPSATICVKFWYKTINDIEFNVKTYSFGVLSSKSSFSAVGNRGNEWLLGQATLNYPASYQIVFEAIDRGQSFGDGEVNLDDVEINYKACTPLGSCDFEDGFCGFTLSREADFEWVILDGYFGLNQNFWNAPTFDHTVGSAAGSYVYLDTNTEDPGTRALLESELIPQETSYQCVQFYLKTNNNTATLNVNRKNKLTGESKNVFTTNGNGNNEGWVLQEVQLPENGQTQVDFPFSFVFEGIVGNTKGQLAFDDVKLYNGTCIGTANPGQFLCQEGEMIDYSLVCDFKIDCSNGLDEKNCGSCDFEDSNLCGWKDMSDGFYRWNRMRNGSLTSFTGPALDHTSYSQNGYYMNLENTPGFSVEAGNLYSPKFPRASSTCRLKFWLVQYGGINSLKVLLNTDGNYAATLFRRNGLPEWSNWTLVDISIGSVYNPFQVVFQSAKSYTLQGVVSIDDVSFENCALPFTNATCSSNEIKCNRGNCVPNERICDFVDDCGDFTDEALPICSSYQKCTFDVNFCDWENDPTSTVKWSRRNGPTVTTETGPDRDHTSGLDSGYYLFLDAFANYNSKSRLLSRNYAKIANQECKLVFYYHMFGDGMGSLNVYLKYSKDGQSDQKIWSQSGDQGRNWLRASLVLNPVSNLAFQFIIEGVIGANARSDIAIDDIALSPGCGQYNSDLPNSLNITIPQIVTTPTPITTTTTTNKDATTTTTTPAVVTPIGSSASSVTVTQQPSNCPAGYCRNGGVCLAASNGGFRCKCQVEFNGDRCENKVEASSEKNQKDLGIGLGISIPALVIIAFFVFVIYRVRNNKKINLFSNQKSYSTMRDENIESSNVGINNPIFDQNDAE